MSRIRKRCAAWYRRHVRRRTGRRLHPAHRRMHTLLIERGPAGYTASALWAALRDEDLSVSREAVHRWLAAAEKQGYVYRQAAPGSRRVLWIWRLAAGQAPGTPGFARTR